MSDDTPTQKFDASGEDAPSEDSPTELISQSEPEAAEPSAERKSKRTIIILAIIGGVLVLVIVILLLLLFLGRGGEPVAAPAASPSPTATSISTSTPTPTPAPTEAPAPPPPPPPPPPPNTGPSVDSFAASQSTIFCNTQAPNPPSYELGFSWSSSNVSAVYFGVATYDASVGALFEGLPPSGNQSSFPYAVIFPCPSASQFYTLTVVGADGQKDSTTITITNIGDM